MTIIGSQDRLEYKSSDFKVEVRVDTCLRYRAAHLWRVFNDTCGGNSTEVTLPQSVADDSPTLAFSHWQLECIDYGVYCLRLTSRYTNVPVEASIDVMLTLQASDLVAIIDGGGSRTVTNQDEIVIDGSTSFDPDLPSYVNQHLAYAWRCEANVSAAKLSLDSVLIQSYLFCAVVYVHIIHMDAENGMMYFFRSKLRADARIPRYTQVCIFVTVDW